MVSKSADERLNPGLFPLGQEGWHQVLEPATGFALQALVVVVLVS